jgi:hypothetical protein
MNYDATQISYPANESIPPGLWMLEPTMLANDIAHISVTRGDASGTLIAKLRFPGLELTVGYDPETLLNHLHALSDAYCPITNVYDSGAMTIKFKAPFYSVPQLYIGKPQMRIAIAYERAVQTHKWVTCAIAEASCSMDMDGSHNKIVEEWTEKFMRTYIQQKENFSLSLSSSG